MKRILNPHAHTDVKDTMLLFIRILVGVLLITHGYPKLVRLMSDEPVKFAALFGMSKELSLTLAMFAELICASLVILGLFTRLAALPIIFTMLVIIFHVHWNDPFGKKELPLLYLASYLYIFFVGAGRYSFDYLFHKKLKMKRAVG